MKLQILYLKREFNVDIFYKEGNKVSQTGTVNEVYEEIITKEHFKSFSKDNKNSQRDDNVVNLDDINRLKMIEAGGRKKEELDN